jgi:hypothetical protein
MVFDPVQSARFGNVKKKLSACSSAWHTCSAEDVSGWNVAPSSIRSCTAESTKALRLQVFAQFSYDAIIHILVEHDLSVFWVDCDDAGLRLMLAK